MMRRIKKVLVALKPWQRGLPVSAYHARFLAERLGAELHLVSCVFDSQVAVDLARTKTEAIGAQAGFMEAERENLEAIAQSFADWGGSVTTKVRWGSPADEAILEEVRASAADLLVIGTHHRQPTPHTRLTHVDWQLMRRCPCPLLLVKDLQFDGYTRMLAGIDPLHRHAEPSGLDRTVLETACTLAEAFDADLSVGHAFPPPEAFALASAVEVLPGVLYGTENIEAVHRQAVLELVANYGIVPGQIHLAPGPVDEVILDFVGEYQIKLVVLGAIKRHRLKQALLGSTAERVVAGVECDVLLVGRAEVGHDSAA